ncbi:MAG: hypothetical protein RQ966_03100 [Acetobacteraceae bacterium]|nr:hypothetical protein [Acetobacteraceae bacterium]
MTLEEIEACIRIVERNGVPEFTLSEGGATLILRTAASQPAAAPTGTIRASAAGVLRLAHGTEGAPPVAAGAPVRPGTVVAFLQVGPCLRPVQATEAGTLGAPLQSDGALVGFGTPLFDLLG